MHLQAMHLLKHTASERTGIFLKTSTIPTTALVPVRDHARIMAVLGVAGHPKNICSVVFLRCFVSTHGQIEHCDGLQSGF